MLKEEKRIRKTQLSRDLYLNISEPKYYNSYNLKQRQESLVYCELLLTVNYIYIYFVCVCNYYIATSLKTGVYLLMYH